MTTTATSPRINEHEVASTYSHAVQLHGEGRIKYAKRRYEKVLAVDPRHAGALHHLGLICHQDGNNDEAARLVRQSLDCDPANEEAWRNLVVILSALDRSNEIIDVLEDATGHFPDSTQLLTMLAQIYGQEKHHEKSADIFRLVIELEPTEPSHHSQLGRVLINACKFEDAIEPFRRACELEPENTGHLFLLGNSYYQIEKIPEALETYEQAIELNPEDARFRCNAGACLLKMGRHDEAVAQLEKSIEIDPDCLESYLFLSSAVEKDDPQRAVNIIEAAIERKPDFAAAYSNLGRLMSGQTMYEEAEACFRAALQIDPETVEAYTNLGSLYQGFGDLDQAFRYYEIALNKRPDSDMTLWNLSLALLAAGKIEDGWDLYGYGFASGLRKPYRPFPGLIWDGEPLANKTIMVWREQGIGDDLRLSTCYDDLIKIAGHVIIEADPRLVPLYQRTWPDATVRAETRTCTGFGTLKEEDVDFDVTAPTGIVASKLRRHLSDFPEKNRPLVVDATRATEYGRWAEELGPGLKIGFAWRSKRRDALRNLFYTEITDWAELLSIPGVHFINLQYDVPIDEIAEAEAQLGCKIHVCPELDLFADLDGAAALTSCMDLVVTAGTSVADMSCALGLPCFSYAHVAHPVCLGTDHVPWFPSFRYYPMTKFEDKAEFASRITRDVRAYITSVQDT